MWAGAGVMTDVLLFFGIFGMCGAFFIVFHILALRLHDTRRLLVFLMGIYLFSALVATVLSRYLIAGYFSSFDCYVIANLGAVLAGFFAAFLYAFLGPATADRSLTAHMLLHLLAKPEFEAEKHILESEYVAGNFFSKRYAECISAGILLERDGVVKLTPKGRRIARLYSFQIWILGLDQRSQHLPSFVDKE